MMTIGIDFNRWEEEDWNDFVSYKEGVGLTDEEEKTDKRVTEWLTTQKKRDTIEGESNGT